MHSGVAVNAHRTNRKESGEVLPRKVAFAFSRRLAKPSLNDMAGFAASLNSWSR